MRRCLVIAVIVATSAAVMAQVPSVDGRWTLDRTTDTRANRLATELVITTSATQVTIHRHWTSDAGAGEGMSSTDVFTLDGRDSRATDGRMGTATIEAGVLTLTLTRVSTSPLQPPGEYRTVTREIYRASGDRTSVERAIYGVRPGEAPGRGPVNTVLYQRATP